MYPFLAGAQKTQGSTGADRVASWDQEASTPPKRNKMCIRTDENNFPQKYTSSQVLRTAVVLPAPFLRHERLRTKSVPNPSFRNQFLEIPTTLQRRRTCLDVRILLSGTAHELFSKRYHINFIMLLDSCNYSQKKKSCCMNSFARDCLSFCATYARRPHQQKRKRAHPQTWAPSDPCVGTCSGPQVQTRIWWSESRGGWKFFFWHFRNKKSVWGFLDTW